jgi:hypothetical protein
MDAITRVPMPQQEWVVTQQSESGAASVSAARGRARAPQQASKATAPTERVGRLEGMPWYAGVRSKEEATSLLKETLLDGEFLVRFDSSEGAHYLSFL